MIQFHLIGLKITSIPLSSHCFFFLNSSLDISFVLVKPGPGFLLNYYKLIKTLRCHYEAKIGHFDIFVVAAVAKKDLV